MDVRRGDVETWRRETCEEASAFQQSYRYSTDDIIIDSTLPLILDGEQRSNMITEKYTDQIKRLPKAGQQVIGMVDGENITVYQAFNQQISEYAVSHQQFGGDGYDFNRMSWIKPGFLWMMHRSGWASKKQQQRILAITLPMIHFKTILRSTTATSYKNELYESEADWRAAMKNTEGRLQWDPDHHPFGNKLKRKAIQLGMKGQLLKSFCTEWIVKIEDITDFVKQEYQKVLDKKLDELLVPFEDVIELDDEEIDQHIGITVL